MNSNKLINILFVENNDTKMPKMSTFTDFYWVSDCCLTPNEQLSSYYNYIMAKTSYIQWNDNDVLCKRPTGLINLIFINASLLKQQYAGRLVAPLWHIILVPNQSVLALIP